MKQPLLMQTNLQIAWLAGLLDGEGCIAFAKRSDYNPHRLLEVRYDVKVAMACETTIRVVHELLVDIVGEDLVSDPHEERRRVKRRRPLWRVEVSSKRGVYDLLRTLEPLLVTKRLEAQLTLRYLERALQSKHYQPTAFDRRLAELATALRHGCGEARLEANELLEQVIPSEAVQGPARAGSRTERVETRSVSPNNNPIHERPASDPSDDSEDEDIVQTPSKDGGAGINSRRLH
jgi:hypothetical protein